MLPLRLYYRLKPCLPWAVRMVLRRAWARRVWHRSGEVWPILESAGRRPDGWPGWPEGKQFALVLTHDVEGPKGLNRCRQLAELEMQLGFRSSFGFVPEGDYSLPPALRAWLIENGFEVAVHDLKHNGKLYSSRTAFAKSAKRINGYLKEWGAVGFRSGFMLHRLDWLHQVGMEYDASTFDTDPFEPQPDGVGTIFPFWVPAPSSAALHSALRAPSSEAPASASSPFGVLHSPFASADSPLSIRHAAFAERSGYVELPYTLVQDFNLFVVLQERTIDVWKKKLAWIAAKGGMALLNVHPDYACLDTQPGRDEYPLARYREFLEWVRREYAGRYWHALPREVARSATRCPRNGTETKLGQGLTDAPSANGKPKIWIDLDNTPHVPFFEPIIEELRHRGYPVVLTARDAFQVCDLADQKGFVYTRVGRHYGKNRFRKVLGLFYRAAQLAPVALREEPLLGLSHGSRSQIILCNALRIPTVLIMDYEFAKTPPLMRPTWELVPQVIPEDALVCPPDHVRKYPGIKEDVYAWKFKPDPSFLRQINLKPSDLIVTVRPPATEAHYHNPESETLFISFMDRACRVPEARVILLPRNQKQADLIRQRWPAWFAKDKTRIPQTALDGLNLIWHSDFVVSGGGTMNREAAALGVPVYSIFRGHIGAVDHQLVRDKRLVLIQSPEDVQSRILFQKREITNARKSNSRQTLLQIVETIEEIVSTAS
jgi:uncharacterized protein